MRQTVARLPHVLSEALQAPQERRSPVKRFSPCSSSLLQAATITACSATVPAAADAASSPTPPCRATVCWTVAGTTSWTPPRKSANVRERKEQEPSAIGTFFCKASLGELESRIEQTGDGQNFLTGGSQGVLKFGRGAYNA